MASLSYPLLALRCYLYDPVAEADVELFLCNQGPLSATLDSVRRQFIPCLIPPVKLGSRISAETLGQPVRGAPAAGSIEFVLFVSPAVNTRAWLDYEWEGRRFDLLAGEVDNGYGGLSLVYTGCFTEVTHDSITAQIGTTEARIELDGPLEERTYGMKITQTSKWTDGASVSAGGNTVTFSGGSPDLVAAGVRPGHKHVWTAGLSAPDLNVTKTVSAVTPTAIVYVETVSGSSGTWAFSHDVPAGLAGKPLPYNRGYVRGWEGDLIDSANNRWQATFNTPCVMGGLRVAGVYWEYTAGTPAGGQWTYSADGGWFQLGSPPTGDVRVDIKGNGWATCKTSTAVQEIVEAKGGTVDTASFAALATDAPGIIGWGTKNPMNALDAIDELMRGVVGYSGILPLGTFGAGILKPPPSPGTDLTLNRTNILSWRQVGQTTPAWRVQAEHTLNWHPITNFAGAVTEEEQQVLRATGLLTRAPYEDRTVLEANPHAIDAPVIRTFVNSEAEAVTIRDRAAAIYSETRQLFEVEAMVNAPDLYDGVAVDYRDADNNAIGSGNFWAHSSIRELGGVQRCAILLSGG